MRDCGSEHRAESQAGFAFGLTLIMVVVRMGLMDEKQPSAAGKDMEMPEEEGKTGRCPGCRKANCDRCGIFTGSNTVKRRPVLFPADFVADREEGFGIAFDIGTTTLAGLLWDLKEGRLLAAQAAANPQRSYGADIVSRLQAAGTETHRKDMQAHLVKSLDEMAKQLLREKKAKRAVIVGNTAMCELFLGIFPAGLIKAPFAPDYQECRQLMGKELGFEYLAETQMTVLPPIGGYAGADALAVHSCVDHEKQERKILALDIGTNGEILLRCKNRCFACSAAAGPALEGGAVAQGMRAAEGAVDKISINGRFPVQDILYRVIGGGKPAGICGSGLVDGLALLLRTGVVDCTGYMRNRQEAKQAGVPERIGRRIEEEDGKCRFLLTDKENPVYLTAEDIRQIQLAVAAIRAAAEVLLSRAGIVATELDKIYLAGAFGCYIQAKSASEIGLLPEAGQGKIVQAGNLAGTGASMALLSRQETERMLAAGERIVHVELAQEEKFEELFLKHMKFGTDRLK